jgi:hypothetical protein
MKRISLVAVVVASVLSAGCLDFVKNMTSPTATPSVDQLTGSWASVSSATSLVDTCTDFHWTVPGPSGTTVTGAFSATCQRTLQVVGTATGTFSGTTIAWTATATGTTPAGAACPVSLAGTADFDGTQIRVPYTGTTCLGPVSGTEILRKST